LPRDLDDPFDQRFEERVGGGMTNQAALEVHLTESIMTFRTMHFTALDSHSL
jgi:hypothetical protein